MEIQAMAVNYTEEQVETMVAWYTAEPTRETVEVIAKEMNKSVMLEEMFALGWEARAYPHGVRKI